MRQVRGEMSGEGHHNEELGRSGIMEKSKLVKLIILCVVVVGSAVLLSGLLSGGHIMYP